MIYIPPYWFHRVTTEESGVGLNIWSTSDGMRVEEAMKSVPIPFSVTWTLEERLLGFSVYLPKLIGTVLNLSEKDSYTYINDMVRLQFVPLFGTLEFPSSKAASYCPTITTEQKVAFFEKFRVKFEESLIKSKIVFDRMRNEPHPEHKMALELFSFIEKLIVIVIPMEELYSLLVSCF